MYALITLLGARTRQGLVAYIAQLERRRGLGTVVDEDTDCAPHHIESPCHGIEAGCVEQGGAGSFDLRCFSGLYGQSWWNSLGRSRVEQFDIMALLTDSIGLPRSPPAATTCAVLILRCIHG